MPNRTFFVHDFSPTFHSKLTWPEATPLGCGAISVNFNTGKNFQFRSTLPELKGTGEEMFRKWTFFFIIIFYTPKKSLKVRVFQKKKKKLLKLLIMKPREVVSLQEVYNISFNVLLLGGNIKRQEHRMNKYGKLPTETWNFLIIRTNYAYSWRKWIDNLLFSSN